MKTTFAQLLTLITAGTLAMACGEVTDPPSNPDATNSVIDAHQFNDAPANSPDSSIVVTVDASVPPDDANVTPDADLTPDATIVPPCTIANDCMMVGGKRVHRVPMNIGTSGNQICAANNLTCVNAPVFSPPAAACVAFHPGVPVTSSTSGWREAVFCNGSATGLACNNQVKCHHCPACTIGNLNCSTGSSSILSEVYVECQ